MIASRPMAFRRFVVERGVAALRKLSSRTKTAKLRTLGRGVQGFGFGV